MFNFIIIVVVFTTIVWFVYQFTLRKQMEKCSLVRYEYKPYIKTFQEEQSNPVSVFGLYKGMFHQPDSWLDAIGSTSKDNTIQPMSWQGLPKSEVLKEGESSNFENSFFG